MKFFYFGQDQVSILIFDNMEIKILPLHGYCEEKVRGMCKEGNSTVSDTVYTQCYFHSLKMDISRTALECWQLCIYLTTASDPQDRNQLTPNRMIHTDRHLLKLLKSLLLNPNTRMKVGRNSLLRDHHLRQYQMELSAGPLSL